jgi:UDP-glucose 4-epimerase
VVSSWLVTGGCGFIGSSLIQKLVASDTKANIRVLDDLSVGSKGDLGEVCKFNEIKIKEVNSSPQGVELVVGDVKDAVACSVAATGCDFVVHLAANTGVGPSVDEPRIDMETNVIGAFNMLEAARERAVRSFIFASSGAPIGELTVPPIHEELAAHPVSPYGASKLAGEGYCSAYYQTYGINTIALRFGNVYGPRSKRKASVVAKFIKQALNDEKCEIYGDGSQTRDFIYIADLIDAIYKASKKEIGGEVFQIASSKEVTINEIADLIKKKLKKNKIDMDLIHSAIRLGDVMRNFSDTSKAKRKLGWEAETGLSEGIEKTLHWFLK